ncbi:MAG: T9SS type A sorting domain-containing protein [Bacteroidales bacterium]
MKTLRILLFATFGMLFLAETRGQEASLLLPEQCRKTILPAVLDNSTNACFPGISSQNTFASCQQHHSVSYVFAYEINRLRGLDGKLNANFYPSHYTYNFFNNADWGVGVTYYYSLDVLKSQGQMTGSDYGSNEEMQAWGWPSGYEKYYNGMHNRLGNMYTIPMTTEEGQNTLKHYLFDHLDGSAAGGVALYSAEAPYGVDFRNLPQGTPEADKPVMVAFNWFANHGGTIIGYNDSIRYDLNNDGKYTNNIDINGDGKVDIHDWEIGGFRIANSYGTWWGDNGFYYALYSAMALPYGAGGIENGNVIILQPLADYQPQLTMKVSFRTICRNHFRIRAGVSADTSLMIPEHSIDFPIFNFQGNCRKMQGFDTIPGSDTLELGLDVSPLLSYTEPGQSARFFLIVENQDSLMNIEGEILHLSFINYSNGTSVYSCHDHNITCLKNGITYASVLANPVFNKLRITTSDLPSFNANQPYQQQFQSTGGMSTKRWSLNQNFSKVVSDSVFKYYPGSFMPLPHIYKPYRPYALPFSFPFAGKEYDTVWVNTLGLVSFEDRAIPYMFTIDDATMLKTVAAIFPAFSRSWFSGQSPVDSVCISMAPDKAIFRWFMRINENGSLANNNMELILYPDGKYEVRYGNMSSSAVSIPVFTGWSGGDGISYDINRVNDRTPLQNQSFMYKPMQESKVFRISESGLLSAQGLDSTKIYSVNVRVEDASHQCDNKAFQVSNGLGLSFSLAGGWDGNLRYNLPVSLNLNVSNKTPQDLQNLSIRLTCSDQAIRFQDSTLNISLLASGSSKTLNNAFTFRLAGFIADQRSVSFTIQLTAGTKHWTRDFILPVIAPQMAIGEAAIIDGDNHQLDPGEVAELEISLFNNGHVSAENLTMSLLPTDTLISILSSSVVQIGQCPPPGNQKYRFLVRASRSVNTNHDVILNINLKGSNIPETMFSVSMTLGHKRLALASLSPDSRSLQPMITALDSLHIPYDIFGNTLFNPDLYSAAFLMNGTSGNEYILNHNEGIEFANYLDHGGNLYMEGNSIWSITEPLLVLPYFKYTSTRVPAFFYDRVKGCSQSFTAGMNFMYENVVNGSIQNLDPVDGAQRAFENSDANPLCLQLTYAGDGYKTIGSMVEFGSLTDSLYPTTQKELMKRYLDFFNINISGPYPLFHATKTNARAGDTITFLDDSYADIISRVWEFPGGTPSASTATNPVVSYSAAGSYDVTLTVSDPKNTKTITRKKIINILPSTGISSANEGMLKIFPNPSKDHVYIRFPGNIRGMIHLELTDFRGIVVLSKTVAVESDEVVLNTGDLSQGLYFLKAGFGEKKWISKLLIQ